MEKLPELTAALVRARMAVSATVFKSGMNQHQRYSYVGHEDVVLHARKALLEAGLTLEETSVEYAGDLVSRTAKGESTVWRWRGTFMLSHVSGESRVYSFESTTQTGDKAAFVASTALDRTALMRVMQLAGTSDENPEYDGYERAPMAPRAPAAHEEPRAPSAPQAQHDPDMPSIERVRALRDDFSLSAWPGYLPDLSTAPDLVAWVACLSWAPGTDADKSAAWKALGVRCAELGIDPSSVAAKARALLSMARGAKS